MLELRGVDRRRGLSQGKNGCIDQGFQLGNIQGASSLQINRREAWCWWP